MSALQNLIYKIEQGDLARKLKVGVAFLGFAAIALTYYFNSYRNFSTPEAMDSAQLARNIANGKGFTTDFVRPLSIHLLQQHSADRDARLKNNHPDIANAPVYPTVLAGLMRALPFDYRIVDPQQGRFTVHQPEVFIAAFNQALLFLAALQVFVLTRRLFDSTTAWLSTLAFAVLDLLWKFSVSGISTLLLLNLFLLMIFALLGVLPAGEDAPLTPRKTFACAVLLGLVIGVGGLTRYSFLWLLIPVTATIFAAARNAGWRTVVVVFALVAVTTAPWLWRNYSLSGRLFGIASTGATQGTAGFQGTTVERSLQPAKSRTFMGPGNYRDYVHKAAANLRLLLGRELIAAVGGSWLFCFFLPSLMVPFRNRALIHLRWFTVISLVVLVLAQAVSRTHLSGTDSSSENLLVLLTPLLMIYATAFFVILLEQVAHFGPAVRVAYQTAWVVVAALPLLSILLPPRNHPVAYPPYFPPAIAKIETMVTKSDLTMSDVPWAVAWYAQRQSVWLTRDSKAEFFRLNDEIKAVNALYLSPLTIDARLVTDMIRQPGSWEHFVMQSAIKGELPKDFPLTFIVPRFWPDQLLVLDWDRTKTPKR